MTALRSRRGHRLGAVLARAASLAPESRRARIALHGGLAVVVLGCLIFAAVSEGRRLDDVGWRLAPGWLGLAVVALLAFQASHAELWRLMMIRLGAPIPARHARAIWNVTLLGRYVPTSALMAVGRAAAAERFGAPKRVSLVSVIYEVLLTTEAALWLGAAFVIALPGLAGEPLRWAILLVPAIGMVVLHPRILHPLVDKAFAALGRDPLPLSLGMASVCGFVLAYGLAFGVAGLGVLGVVGSLHEVDAGDAPREMLSYAVGFVSSMIGFILPAGLGARETGTAGALSTTLPFSLAVAVAIAVRALQFAIELFYAAVSPVLARRTPDPEGATA